jgi:hypothetical protein
MKASDLKYEIEKRGTCEHFFTHKTMKFFGDKMANYGVRTAKIDTYSEKNVPVYELYRRHPVKYGLQDSAYFRQDNFERAYKERGE